jgi:hypothetical protein
MTTGALIFARNNEQIDYVAMANWSAKNIQRHLDIPTHIVTDESMATDNSRHFTDVGTVTWHNLNRMDAYDASPWDRTLVLDADYVVASDQLKVLLNSNQDFLAHGRAYDVTGLNDFEGLNYFGDYRMPMTWATVMMFRKSTHARLIFDCMQMIQANWRHYKDLYRIASSTYRNDHALSIALNIVNGQTLEYTSIPWDLASVTPEHTVTRTSKDCYRIDYVDRDKRPRWTTIRNQDFHAMGKQHLEKIIETC